MLAKVILPLIILTLSSQVFAWGKTGHRIVAEYSKTMLTPKTFEKVKVILGHESMNEASLWPDRIKSDALLRKKYSHLHYISFKKSTKLKNKKLQKKEHVISALIKFEATLRSLKSSAEDKKIALRFIIHLMGDLHQPLHVGYLKDKGGNNVNLKWFGERTNLHRVWDEHIIDMEDLSFTEYTQKLISQDPKLIEKYTSGDYLSWAQESRDYLKSIYTFKSAKYWEYEYSYKHLKIVEQRLTQAGVRLAMVLNRALK